MFDARTGMFFWAAETTMLSALLITLWLNHPERRQHLYLAMGFIAASLGILLVALRGAIPAFVSIQFGNILCLVAHGCWIAGFLKFDRRKVEGWVAIPALIWIAFMFVPAVRDSMANRIVLFYSAAAIGYFMIAGVLLTPDGPISIVRKQLAAVLVLQGLTSGVTALRAAPDSSYHAGILPLTMPVALSTTLGFIAVLVLGAKLFMEQEEQRLQRLALTDYLTGVLNRRGLAEEFAAIKKRGAEGKAYIALILFDLDHFKTINDEHGHQAGDDVLVKFCAVATRIIGDQGLFVRMGGEEFACLMETCAPATAITVAEAIRADLAGATIAIGSETVPVPATVSVTVSAGIAKTTIEDADLNKLLTFADRALYAAKNAGRNRTAVRHGNANIVIGATDRPQNDPCDNNADRQVAVLNRISALAKR